MSCSKIVPTISADAARRRMAQATKDRPLVVQYFAPWCPHCAEAAPEVDRAAAELCDSADVVRVNVDYSKSFAEAQKVENLPTVAVYAGGKQIAREEGEVRASRYVDLVRGRRGRSRKAK